MRRGIVLLVAVSLLCAAPAVAAEAPGAPGAIANWTPGDKDGFGTARPLASNVWFPLQGGELTEVYAPDLGTPSFRDLQFIVSDGRTFSERETDVAKHVTRLAEPRSLTYRQGVVDAPLAPHEDLRHRPGARGGARRHPLRVAHRAPYKLYVLADPALSNTGDDVRGRGLVAYDATNASDGWTDLQADHRMDWRNATASTPGNVVQTGEYELPAGDARAARGRLRSIAATANSGRLLPEQVWDDQPPLGHTPGTPTFSATPLGWTHAQLVRLAWSVDAGRRSSSRPWWRAATCPDRPTRRAASRGRRPACHGRCCACRRRASPCRTGRRRRASRRRSRRPRAPAPR